MSFKKKNRRSRRDLRQEINELKNQVRTNHLAILEICKQQSKIIQLIDAVSAR